MVSKMKLFLLTRKEEPKGYDYFKRFVIAAKNTKQARKMAAKNAKGFRTGHDEDWLDHTQTKISGIATSSKYSSPRIVIGEYIGG